MNELDPLYQAIRSLEPTQSGGFEGFIRDMFAEVTGQGFRLMKSGPQGGVDVLGDTSGTGLVVGIEGKHYAEGTRLPLDSLKSKIRDAAIQFPEMDIWTLAATRSLSQGDVKALEDTGARDGIDVLVLDWDSDSTELPQLAVLCAMASTTTSARFESLAGLDDVMRWVHEHPSYAGASYRLSERLKSPLVGYGAARTAMAQWLQSRMRNIESARLAFDSYATLLDPDAHRIDRPKISDLLDQWWPTSGAKPGALLGDEGFGKTWAALGWWLRMCSAEPNFPLTIVIPAKNVSSSDADNTLAIALHSTFRIRNVEFWEARVRRWLTADAKTPNLLVIVDGLNQNWMFKDWSEFVLTVSGAERRGKVALLLTARPDFYRSRLKSFQDLPVQPEVIPVRPFDDEELRQLLATYGIPIDEFGQTLLPLLRVPRLCHRAVRRRKELEDSADITPERLVYEDWRGRQPAALKAMDDAGFKEFLANLARRLKVDPDRIEISRQDLLQELTLESGDSTKNYEGVLSEIIDGSWLVETGRLNQFKVNPERLSYALGLALVDELSGVASDQEARALLDETFDVFQGLDSGVRILRCASVFAMMEKSIPELVRQLLLSYWLESQNFGAADFDTFWKCIGSSPDSVLDVAERAWFIRSNRHSEDEVLVKALGNSFKWSSVATACEARLTKWFEGYWLDPLVGEILGKVPDDEHSRKRKSDTQQRAMAWERTVAPHTFGIAVENVAAEDRAWGSYRAIELMSWLPRKPLLRPITAWAVTRGIMGKLRQEEMFSWILRWNEEDHDETETALLQRASELTHLGAVGVEAARALLRALATRRSQIALLALPTSLGEPRTSRGGKPKPERPAESASEEYVTKLRIVADSISEQALLDELRHKSAPQSANLYLDLARWAPDSRRKLERARSRIVLRELAQSEMLTEELQKMLPVLQRVIPLLCPETVLQWKAVAGRARGLCHEWNWKLQLGAFIDEPASAQIELLDQAPRKDGLGYVGQLLNPLDVEAAGVLKSRLDGDASDEDLLFWLEYLNFTARSGRELNATGVANLFSHPNAKVREDAFKVAYLDDSTTLANCLADSAWSWKQATSKGETALGSILLTKSSCGADGSLVDRVHPEALGALVEKFSDQDIYLSGFAEYVQAELLELRTAKSRSFPRALLNRHYGWERLTEERGEDLEQWLKPFLEKKSRRLLGGWGESFPLLDAIEAISHRNPVLATSLMTAALEDDASSGMRMGGLHSSALRLTSDEANDVRKFVLNDANNDEKLYGFTSVLIRTGQQNRLYAQIDTDLSAEMAGHVARGVTLAGFLMPSEEADDLWKKIPDHVPSSGWLHTVKNAAQERYARAKACFHWFGRFIDSSSEDEAFMAFELFLHTIDPRFVEAREWSKRRRYTDWPYLRKVHWGLHIDTINSASKKVAGEWKKSFLCTNPPLSNQYPNRR